MMTCLRHLFVLFLILVGIGTACAESVRPAIWAGKFYPAQPKALQQTVRALMAKAAKTQCHLPTQGSLRGLILPHAGYAYSGWTAAHAHHVLPGTCVDKVILMGPDHRVGFSGAAISDVDAYQTPLGKSVLHPDARRLCARYAMFKPVGASDRSEHSLEVILPFLQTDLPSFKLVPIVLGACDPTKVARALIDLVGPKTLVVASADLSHYLPYPQAVSKDQETIKTILRLDEKPLLADSSRTCGRLPVAVLIHLARHYKWHPVLLHYANSGDTGGDRDAVVGYAAIAFYGDIPMSDQATPLTPEQGRALLHLARQTLCKKLGRGQASPQDNDLNARLEDPMLQQSSGVFVTLKINNNLRGCIGTLSGHEPLVRGVRMYALHAAFDDPRFGPLTAEELDRVTIEVSVLTQPQPLAYNDARELTTKLRPGVDGVTIRKGVASATFLPQVWEQLPATADFLSHLCLKAGLAADEWRDGRLEVETYQVQYFEEPHGS